MYDNHNHCIKAIEIKPETVKIVSARKPCAVFETNVAIKPAQVKIVCNNTAAIKMPHTWQAQPA